MPRPIVIIHGWSDESSSFTALQNHIASISGNVFQINLADYISMDDEVRFDDLITAMDVAWDKVRLPRDAGAVDTVVHSTGGLVIRNWLADKFPKGGSPVKRLLMLAPANFGSPLAHKGRSFFGRIVKGFKSEKRFQTGSYILKGLELASPYSWDLAMKDRFSSPTLFKPGEILCTVMVGNTGYGGIMAAANEDGTDGTVRVSTANLNCAKIDADFATKPLKPTFSLRRSSGRTAFRILDGDNHSSAAMKNRGPVDETGRASITRALTVPEEEFDAWCDECDARTAAVLKSWEDKREKHKYGYQNTVVRVVDDADEPVKDYFLEFYIDDKDDRHDEFARRFHEDVIRTVHAYGDDPSFRSLMIDCTTLLKAMDENGWSYIKLSLSAMPEFVKNKYVGYRTFTDKDIGAVRLTREQVEQAFVKNRTLLIQIKIHRERSEDVFKIKRA